MAGLGIPEDDMVRLVINPATKKPISPTTLRKHFPEELRTGIVKANVKGGLNLLKLTETSAAAAIFWAKVRLHMKETASVELPGAGAAVLEDEEAGDLNDLARRIAFTLVLAGRQVTPKKKPK